MHDFSRSGLENVCREFLGAFKGLLSWKWDDRFETALGEFGVDNKEKVRAIVERYLNSAWDKSSIRKAPDIVRGINKRLGGLMPGQMLFTSDTDQDTFIFCAWWPWGDGKTISIRVAPSLRESSGSEGLELTSLFKKTSFA